MAHNTDFSRISAAANDGLSVWEVARALGRNVLDVGQLCGDIAYENGAWVRVNVINKWAKCKPQRVTDRLAPLTDAVRAANDYGFDTTEDSGMARSGGADAVTYLMNKIISNGGASWNYLVPRGMNNPSQGHHEWFRLLDFDGYYKDARAPFRVPSHGTTLTAPVTGYLDSVIKETSDVEIDVTQMAVFADAGDMNLACIVRNAGHDRLFILDDPDPFASEDEVTIPINLNYGTNYCQFVYTDFDPTEVDANGNISSEAGDDYKFIALPDCYQVFVVSAIADAILVSEGWGYNGNVYFFRVGLTQDGYVDNIKAQGIYTNGTGDDRTMQLHVSFRGPEGTVQKDTASFIAYVDPEDNTIEVPALTASEIEDITAQGEFDPSDLGDIEVKMWWSWTAGYSSPVRYYNFTNGQIVATDPGWAALTKYYIDN